MFGWISTQDEWPPHTDDVLLVYEEVEAGGRQFVDAVDARKASVALDHIRRDVNEGRRPFITYWTFVPGVGMTI